MKFAGCGLFFLLSSHLIVSTAAEEGYCDAKDASCNTDQIQEKLRNKMVVAAIDFGTTYSGWAYQAKHEYKKDPTNIKTSKWEHNDILSKKTPTTVLIKPDGKTLEAFGYEAETTYLTLAAEEEHYNYFFFKRFKMMLYDKKNLDSETMLTDDKGRQLPAITVFSLAIGFLKDNLLADLKKRDASWGMEDVHWVLTVPAIWNDTAKSFMRKSAVAAGIKNEDLQIALEPEAASLYCRLLPVEKQINEQGEGFVNNFQPGRKYMVLDAGGGTIDVTVHELLSNIRLKELYKATGGPWGGIEVDGAFEQMLATIMGGHMYETFKEQCAYDHLDMMRSFEQGKRSVTQKRGAGIVVRLPSCFVQLLEQENGESTVNRITSAGYSNSIRIRWDRMILSNELSVSFFKDVLRNITEHVISLLDKPGLDGIDSLLLVGGFADCSMLQDAVRSALASKIENGFKVFSPPDAELVIVKGAVLFGFKPQSVEERIAKFTYGIKTVRNFVPEVHDKIKCNKFMQKDTPKCDNLFAKLVEIDAPIRYGEVQGTYECLPLTEESRNVTVFIYACSDRYPEYVIDSGCERRGKIDLELLDTSKPLHERTITVSFMFSDSEITVSARENLSGNKVEAKIKFD